MFEIFNGLRDCKILFLFLCLCAGPSVLAQQLEVEPEQEQQEQGLGQEDSLKFTRRFPGKFNLRLILQDRPMYLQLREGGNNLEYRPNTRPMIGFGANILDIGASFSFQLPGGGTKRQEEFGTTISRDYQLNLFIKHFLTKLHYQHYQGFYLNNTAAWQDRVAFENRPLQQDLVLRKALISALYIINPDKLTLRVYNNAQKQVRGGGSFTVMTAVNYFSIKNNDLLIPRDFRSYYRADARLREGRFGGFSFMPGYSHSFVVENFYMNLTVAAGPELQYRQYQSKVAMDAGLRLQGNISLMGAVGYDNNVYFAGIHFADQRNRYRGGALQIMHNTGLLRLSIGRRFPDNRWIKSIRKWDFYQTIMDFL